MDGRELKRYEHFKEQSQLYKRECDFLRYDRDYYRREWYFTQERLNKVQERAERLEAENCRLKQQNKELLAAAKVESAEKASPAPVKPSLVHRRRKRPGRKEGHPAALRPMPDHIDFHQEVPLPVDPQGRESCPRCNACLLDVQSRQRLYEDVIPARKVVRCYHTRSGWCPLCRKQVESRAPDQPPAANLPHAQLGINALAMGILLRIEHRIPFRQVSRVFADLPEFTVCPGAIARQIQRAAAWFEGDYEKLLLQVRSSPHVHADETGWRTDGRNGYLWALATPTQTYYHVDKSRAGKVIKKLLGKAFGGTLVSDFYSAYSRMDCKKQKCLLHLLRELSQSAEKSAAFASGHFLRTSKRLLKEMLLLKHKREELDERRYIARVRRLERRLDELTDNHYDEPNARRLARRMRKHQTELTAFLWDKQLDGTNNAAERAIRPAVVARKISGGSRSRNGAEAWATLASLLRSARQQGKNVLETIKAKLIAAWASDKPPTAPAGP